MQRRTIAAAQFAVMAESPVGWPQIFNRMEPKPLAVGIHKQLKAAVPDVKTDIVFTFLYHWTSSVRYIKALAKEGALRFNLDGTEAGPVDEENRARALRKIKVRKLRKREKRRMEEVQKIEA